MTRRTTTTRATLTGGILLLAGSLLGAVPAMAATHTPVHHTAAGHTPRGQALVEQVRGDVLTIKTPRGQQKEVNLSAHTKIFEGGHAVAASALRAGERVTISGIKTTHGMQAAQITIWASAAQSGSHGQHHRHAGVMTHVLVKQVHGDILLVETPHKATKKVELNARTRILQNGHVVKAVVLHAGERVTIHGSRSANGTVVAQEIILG